MAKTLCAWAAVAALIGSAALSRAAEKCASADPFSSASFAVTLPAGASATKQEGPDFDVYSVKWSETGNLGIYQGCCPQTFLTESGAEKRDLTINGLAVRQATLRDGDRTSKELHFEFTPEPGTGAFRFIVHAWYTNLSGADAKVAGQILSTIRRKPHG